METYNQQERNETAENAEFDSTIVQFYERCCESAEVKRPWHTLHPHVQIQFMQATAYIHQVVKFGG